MKKRLTFLAGLVLLCTTLVACPPAVGNQVLTAVQVKNGDSQTAVVGTELPEAISVHAIDESGAPMAGQIVNFKVTQGGGSVFAGSALTDANGNASERWTLGTLAGVQKVEVRAVNSAGVAIVFATIQATAIAGAPASILIASGDAQSAEIGRTLANPVAVLVKDQFGNPTPGVELTFVAQNGGSVSPTTALTDSAGKTSTAWKLGVTQLGQQSVQVFVSTLPSVQASASATATETIPFAISIVGGNQQTLTQHVALPEPLRVRVTDYLGNPKSGVYVEFFSSPGYGYTEGLDSNFPITNINGIALWDGTIHSSGGQKITARAKDNQNISPVFNIAPVEFSFNVTPSGSPFEGTFEMTSSFNDNPSVIGKNQVTFRNGNVVYVNPALGGFITSGSIDIVTGVVAMNARIDLSSNNLYSGNFIVSSGGIVTGSGSFQRTVAGIPTGRIGTWTAIKIHD